MYTVNVGKKRLHLIPLEVPDEMPTNITQAALLRPLRFRHQLLNIVLTEVSLTLMIKGFNRLKRMLFADGYQLNG
jgi:hypothetical protein